MSRKLSKRLKQLKRKLKHPGLTQEEMTEYRDIVDSTGGD